MNTQRLARLGSHDPETEHQIEKRIEFDKLKELLAKKDCTIEKMQEDGNCLFRAVARQVYTVTKRSFKRRGMILIMSSFTKASSLLLVPILKRGCQNVYKPHMGGNIEIQGISELCNVGVMVWLSSETGER